MEAVNVVVGDSSPIATERPKETGGGGGAGLPVEPTPNPNPQGAAPDLIDAALALAGAIAVARLYVDPATPVRPVRRARASRSTVSLQAYVSIEMWANRPVLNPVILHASPGATVKEFLRRAAQAYPGRSIELRV